jgi:hypothetical protein
MDEPRQAELHQQRGDALRLSSPSEALKEYTQAIELLIPLGSDVSLSTAQRTRYRTQCLALLSLAEEAKKTLSVKEQTILLKSSRINGGKFPPVLDPLKSIVARPPDGKFT